MNAVYVLRTCAPGSGELHIFASKIAALEYARHWKDSQWSLAVGKLDAGGEYRIDHATAEFLTFGGRS